MLSMQEKELVIDEGDKVIKHLECHQIEGVAASTTDKSTHCLERKLANISGSNQTSVKVPMIYGGSQLHGSSDSQSISHTTLLSIAYHFLYYIDNMLYVVYPVWVFWIISIDTFNFG